MGCDAGSWERWGGSNGRCRMMTPPGIQMQVMEGTTGYKVWKTLEREEGPIGGVWCPSHLTWPHRNLEQANGWQLRPLLLLSHPQQCYIFQGGRQGLVISQLSGGGKMSQVGHYECGEPQPKSWKAGCWY